MRLSEMLTFCDLCGPQFVCFPQNRDQLCTVRATCGADDLWGVTKGIRLKQQYRPGWVVAGQIWFGTPAGTLGEIEKDEVCWGTPHIMQTVDHLRT